MFGFYWNVERVNNVNTVVLPTVVRNDSAFCLNRLNICEYMIARFSRRPSADADDERPDDDDDDNNENAYNRQC